MKSKQFNLSTAASRGLAASLALLAAAPGARALTELGPGALFLDVAAGITYDSNIYTNSREVNDTIARLTPTLSYVQDRGLLRLVATGSTSLYEYFDDSSQSGTDWVFGFDLSGMHREPAPAAGFTLGGNYADQSIASEEIATRIDLKSYGLKGSFDFDLSEKTGMGFSGGWGRRDYADAAFSDSEDYNARADFLYAYSEKLTLTAGYRWREIDHRGTKLESDTYIVGARGVFTPKLSGSVEVGGSSGDRLDGTQLYYSVGLDWAADEKTSWAINGSRDSTPSVLSGARATATSIGLSLAQRFTDRLSGNASVGYGKFERDGALRRKDDFITAGAGLSLAVGRSTSLFANASYEDRDSNSAVSDYGRFTLSAGGSMRF